MDVTTFYALFSATCFTLVGLWWNVVQGHREWLQAPASRRDVGGIYLSFLLPALMGLFAQVGGTKSPGFWRVSFVVIAVVGGWSTVRHLRRQTRPATPARSAPWKQLAALVLYAAIAVVGAAPELLRHVSITPLQAEASLLILLIVVAHALVWEFMTQEPESSARPDGAGALAEG
jgi:hypothetical protein